MKKTKTNDNDKMLIKLIDFGLVCQIEDSHSHLKMIDLQIKGYKLQLEFLEDNKPFWFQKKKIEEHNNKVEGLKDSILNCYAKFGEEMKMIDKMQKALKKDCND